MSNMDFKAAVAAAKQRAQSEAKVVTYALHGQDFEFHFLPDFSAGAIPLIEQFEKVQHESDVHGDVVQAIGKLMDYMVTTESREHIATLIEENLMSVGQLMELTVKGIEAITGRPFVISSSSATAFGPPGAPTTASAPPLASTPSI